MKQKSRVSNLPEEILLVVFDHLKEIEPPVVSRDVTRRFRRPRCNSDLGWLKIMHVCSLWRKIAASFSPLWLEIPGHRLPPVWVRNMLQYARRDHLSLSLFLATTNFATTMDLIREVTKHTHRMSSLALDTDTAELLLRPNTVPNLQAVSIHGNAKRAAPGYPLIQPPLFDGPMPDKLHSLSLHDCFVVLNDAWLDGIVHFDITFPSSSYAVLEENLQSCWSLQTAARALPLMRRLETLKLVNAFPVIPDLRIVEHISAHPIQLPASLKTLTLYGPTFDGQCFMACLFIPSTTTMDVTLVCGTDTAFMDLDLSAVFLPIFRTRPAPHALSLHLARGSEHARPQLSVRTWSGEVDERTECIACPESADVAVRVAARYNVRMGDARCSPLAFLFVCEQSRREVGCPLKRVEVVVGTEKKAVKGAMWWVDALRKRVADVRLTGEDYGAPLVMLKDMV
ncbi:hypothetical protein OF83DRAFT_892243 [Amylostereum chailletii]|nr:hypothetical protein OF83DRAFT_892243 [Amylostereum chailletii]